MKLSPVIFCAGLAGVLFWGATFGEFRHKYGGLLVPRTVGRVICGILGLLMLSLALKLAWNLPH